MKKNGANEQFFDLLPFRISGVPRESVCFGKRTKSFFIIIHTYSQKSFWSSLYRSCLKKGQVGWLTEVVVIYRLAYSVK